MVRSGVRRCQNQTQSGWFKYKYMCWLSKKYWCYSTLGGTEASYGTKSKSLQFPQSKISWKTMSNCWLKSIKAAKPVGEYVILTDANVETKDKTNTNHSRGFESPLGLQRCVLLTLLMVESPTMTKQMTACAKPRMRQHRATSRCHVVLPTWRPACLAVTLGNERNSESTREGQPLPLAAFLPATPFLLVLSLTATQP